MHTSAHFSFPMGTTRLGKDGTEEEEIVFEEELASQNQVNEHINATRLQRQRSVCRETNLWLHTSVVVGDFLPNPPAPPKTKILNKNPELVIGYTIQSKIS